MEDGCAGSQWPSQSALHNFTRFPQADISEDEWFAQEFRCLQRVCHRQSALAPQPLVLHSLYESAPQRRHGLRKRHFIIHHKDILSSAISVPLTIEQLEWMSSNISHPYDVIPYPVLLEFHRNTTKTLGGKFRFVNRQSHHGRDGMLDHQPLPPFPRCCKL